MSHHEEENDNLEIYENYSEEEWQIVDDHNAIEEIIEWQVDKGQESERIDKYITSKVKDATRSKIQIAIDEGRILINNEPTKSNYKVRPLDIIKYTFYHHPDYTKEIIPEDIPLNIVYEDEHLLVINKPANMVVHPGHGNYTGTVVNALAHYLKAQNHNIVNARLGLVHRIDKDTTGLLVIAKNEQTMLDLQKQFKEHTVHRRYVALVWGDFDEEEGTIDIPIGRNERFRKKMQVYHHEEGLGKKAVTHWKVLQRFLYVTLLEFRLETGRTHQIRVHSQHMQHPLFNDSTYGGDKILKGTVFSKYKQFIDNCFRILPRQALHAKELGFIHPVTKEKMIFTSDLPEDMKSVIDKWTAYSMNKF